MSSRFARSIARGVFALAIVGADLAVATDKQVPRKDVLSAADRRALETVVSEVRQAILDENVKALLGHISRVESLVCTDTPFSYAEVRAFLENRDSHLFMSLFDSRRFAMVCGHDYPREAPPMSDKEFLEHAETAVSIKSWGRAWATVTVMSADERQYSFEWSFHREGGTWKLAGRNFIIGSCSCG